MKPLKAPKKEKKDMDEDEIAFKAKQAAGTIIFSSRTRRVAPKLKSRLKMPKLEKKWPTRQRAKDR